MCRRSMLIVWTLLFSVMTAQPQAQNQPSKVMSRAGVEDRLTFGDNAGRIAPDFKLPALDGGTINFSGYRGKAVLLNFWATWCGPCKIEMPWFVELQKKYQSKGFQVIGVAEDADDPSGVAQFAKRLGVNYPIAIGSDAVSDLYGGVEALPSSFYIDRNGRIVRQVSGLISFSEMERNISKALESPRSSSAPGSVSQAAK